MFQYLALLWNTRSAAESDAANALLGALNAGNVAWQRIFESPGRCVLCTKAGLASGEVYRLAGEPGVIVGTLFKRDSSELVPQLLQASASQSILRSSGRDLVDRYWGRYVAFLVDEASNTTRILRDPSGQLECFTASYRGVRLYFSSMRGCAALGLLSVSINRRYLEAEVCGFVAETRETGLDGVSRLLAGECETVCGTDICREHYWNPFAVARQDPIHDAESAIQQVRRTTRMCVQAWAARHQRILTLLSGGLDSSIVSACLRDAPSRPIVTALNFHYLSGSGNDEREFARLAARHSGCELLEREMQPRFRLSEIFDLPVSVSPSNIAGGLEQSRMEHKIAREVGATAIFSGQGGDQLFYQHGGDLICADYLRMHRFGRSLPRLALRVARWERDTVWHVLAHAARLAYRVRPGDVLDQRYVASAFIEPELARSAVAERRFVHHPWFKTEQRIPPGKYWHAFLLLAQPYGMDSPIWQPGDPDDVYPLYSQPLIELCLRIPTYILALDGCDRAAARRAFVGDVPAQILNRRSKGMVREFAREILAHNIDFIRSVLLDGALVRERILNRGVLEAALSGRAPPEIGYPAELLKFVSLEAWVRGWSHWERQAAA